MSESIKITNDATPDQGVGTPDLTPAESLLIANFRAGNMHQVLRLYLDYAPTKDGSPRPAEPLPLSENAFHRLSVCVLNTMLLDFIEPDELTDRFEPVWLLAQIEQAIRQGMLNRVVDREDMRRLMILLGY